MEEEKKEEERKGKRIGQRNHKKERKERRRQEKKKREKWRYCGTEGITCALKQTPLSALVKTPKKKLEKQFREDTPLPFLCQSLIN